MDSTHQALKMNPDYQYYKYPNESFSGCDMTASIVYSWEENGDGTTTSPVIEGAGKSINLKSNKKKKFATHTLGELQTISYSIHMEKRPVRSIGNVNAKDYVMGPRTIAGSLVFAVFNRHFAKNIMAEHNEYFSAGQAFLVDELPPFNIVVSFANEYGLRSKLVIYGVRLLNEGQVMSVNDVYTENTYQFMATDLEYMNDENKYESRGKDFSSFLKIKNDYNHTPEPYFKPNDIGKALVHYTDFDKDDVENITLSVSVNDATRNNNNGRAMFSLYPKQTEGNITITDSNNDTHVIQVNGATSYSIQLPPDMYNARFSKPEPDKWKCNAKSFDIKEFRDSFSTKRYAPIIEVVTDTTIQAYSNEPTHNKFMLQDGEDIKYFDIKSRRVKLTNLERCKKYILATCNGPDTLTSPSISVTTFSEFDKPFNDFKRMVEYNMGLLVYKDATRYYSILDKAKELASKSSNFQSPTDSIVLLKQRYETELNALNRDDVDYNDKYAELTYNIFACNELIYLSNKVHNNTMNNINKDTPTEIPEHFFDEFYNNNFIFSEDTTKAEFYRVYKGVPQSAHTATSNMFKEIDGNTNSFMYLGKSGVNHFVQSINGHVRSPKLEFYVMTNREKQEAILSAEGKDTISEQSQNKINASIKDELGTNIDNSMLNRAFMRKVKSIDEAIILDVEVTEKDDENIKVVTIANKIINDSFNSVFYLAVANQDDIVNNDFIYKKMFTNKDKEIILNDIDFALFRNKDYALWLEDSNFNQISNVTTFNMNTEEQMNDRLVFEYELELIIKEIKSRLYPYLPGSIYDSLASHIEYNEEITKTNIIDKTLEYLLHSGLGESVITKCLKAIKVYIGTIMESDEIISEVKYKNENLTFKCSKQSSIVCIAINKETTSYTTIASNDSNSIDVSAIDGDYVFILAITPDMKYKSDVMYINKISNALEVL